MKHISSLSLLLLLLIGCEQPSQKQTVSPAQLEQQIKRAKKIEQTKKRKAAFAFLKFQQIERLRLKGVRKEFGIEESAYDEQNAHIPSFDDNYAKSIPLKIGAAGPVSSLKVIQVINNSTFIARFGTTEKFVLAKGWDTTSFVDGYIISGRSGVWITGITEYISIFGANKRVYVVEPIELEFFEKEYQERIEKSKASRIAAQETDLEPIELDPDSPRKWRSGGYSIVAVLVKVDGENVTLRKESGSELTLPIDRLSKADREFVSAHSP